MAIFLAACGEDGSKLGQSARPLKHLNVKLSAAGVSVLPDGTPTAPEPSERRSAVALWESQLQSMVLQAEYRGGTPAVKLNEVVEAGGGLSASQLILGWAAGSPSPAAKLARELIGDAVDWPDRPLSDLDGEELRALDADRAGKRSDLSAVVIPDMVLALFAADVTRAAAALPEPGPNDTLGDPRSPRVRCPASSPTSSTTSWLRPGRLPLPTACSPTTRATGPIPTGSRTSRRRVIARRCRRWSKRCSPG